MSKTVKVKQVRSVIGTPEKQRRVIKGLGLNRLNQVRELPDTPEVQGMITKVRHLVQVVD